MVDSLAAVEMAKTWTLLPEMLTQTVDSTDPSFTIPDDATVVTKTVEFDNEIDFVEYVQLDADIDASSFRSLRIELESPSGIVSVMSPELSNANGINLTALREPFRFGSSRHLGERAEGVWTLRVSDKESGTPLNDGVEELATIASWGVKLFGHRLRPSAPQSVQVTVGPGAGMVTARWAAPVHIGAGLVNGYELAHIASAATARDDDDWTTVDIAADTLTGTVAVSEETDVRVRATNSEADGEWSETITVTPRTEEAGVTVVPDAVLNLPVVEGGMGTYTVVLDSEPSDVVTVTAMSEDTDAVTVSPTTLTFTTGNWDTARTVTVTAEQDNDADDEEVDVSHVATSSGDTAYNNLAGPPVVVRVTDNEVAGMTVVPDAVLNFPVVEGGMGTYTVVLDSEPSDVVTVAAMSGDTDAVTVSPTTLTFTTGNWDTARTVTVTAEQDNDADDEEVDVLHVATSNGDSAYNLTGPPVTVKVTDNEVAGVTVVLDAGLNSPVVEGGTGTYTVVLDSEPSDVVTVMAMSEEMAAVTVLPTALTFTTGNWDTAQTVTVTAEQDNDRDNEKVEVSNVATSADSAYNNLRGAPLTVIVTDDDDVAVVVSFGQAAYSVDEGDTVSVTVMLSAVPGRVVVVPMTATGRGAGPGDYSGVFANLTFATNETSKTITFAATQDMVDDDGESVSLAFGTPLPTGVTAGLVSATVVTIVDDDAAGVTVVPDPGLMSTVGEGGTGIYTVVLESEPSGDVTVTARSADVLAVTVSPMVLTFTTGDWATAQTVTVRAEHDTDADDESVDVLHTAASSVDTVYNNLAVETVTVMVTDDDEVAVTVVPGMGLMSTVGEGDTGTYTVVLESEPSGDVTVTAASADVLAVTVSPMVLTFTTGDWATAQTVTVRAEHDTDADDEEVDVLHTAASSVDTVYNNLAVETVTVTVTDDDANTAPVFLDTAYPGGEAARSVAENTVSGNLGDPITATDEDVGDTLMYSVAATTDTDAAEHLMDFDRDFAVDSESGQISVNAEAMIDFEDRSTYTVLFQVSDGNDASSMPDMTADATLTLTVTVTDVDEPGTVSFGADPDVGTALTASVTDPEVVSGTPTWQWAEVASARHRLHKHHWRHWCVVYARRGGQGALPAGHGDLHRRRRLEQDRVGCHASAGERDGGNVGGERRRDRLCGDNLRMSGWCSGPDSILPGTGCPGSVWRCGAALL